MLPSDRQLRIQEMGFYAFVHFSVNTFTGREWGDGTESPEIFRPEKLDAAQWVRAIQSAGMKGLILTCKHHDGFCLWPSEYTDHSVAASPWKQGRGDVVREVSDACRQAGIAFGVYLSPWDRHDSRYGSGKAYDDYFVAQLTELLTNYGPVCSVWLDGACGEGPNGKKQHYDWERYYETVRRLQPEACIHVCGPDVRWCGNEAGETREAEWSVVPRRTRDTEKIASLSQHSEDAAFRGRAIRAQDRNLGSREVLAQEQDLVWYPAEVNTSIRPGWFWHPEEDDQVKPLEQLIEIYEKSVGGNAMFLLNIPPTNEGLFHPNDVQRLQEMGKYLRKTYIHNLAEKARIYAPPAKPGHMLSCLLLRGESDYIPEDGDEQTPPSQGKPSIEGTPFDSQEPARLLSREKSRLTMELYWESPISISRLVLMENLRYSQRVERFAVDILRNDKWVQIREQNVIGFRRILRLENLQTNGLRIRILDSRGTPVLRFLGVYGNSNP